MIGIYLQYPVFEQDIRELLMAFFPGESFSYERSDNPDFFVEGTMNHLKTQYRITVSAVSPSEENEPIEIDLTKHTESKNKIKRRLYQLLHKMTTKLLPWGTLTGIRPVKIVTTLMEEGQSDSEIRTYLYHTYLISAEKADLLLRTAHQETELLSVFPYQEGYSLYVGIPFCPTTCLYCSFTSYPISAWSKKTGQYLNTLFYELDYVAKRMAGTPLHTIYIGGGTPTALTAEDIEQLLSKITSTFDLTEVREFTVESGRPDSITREKLLVLKKYQVTRISINPQTMKQQTLDLIGRHHTVESIKECYYMAREMGFDNINMDLIVGLPNETIEDVRNTMEQMKELGPDSITIHSLAIKRAARLNTMKEQYKDVQIDNTQEIIDLTSRYALEMGMNPYYLYRQKNMAGNFENVGYAKPQKASLYNILIMEEKQSILACGAGTSSKIVYISENRLERAENVKDINIYISRIDEMIERKEKLLAKIEN